MNENAQILRTTSRRRISTRYNRFQLTKCFFRLIGPLKLNVCFAHACQRFSNVRKVTDKPPIIGSETEGGSNVLKTSRSRPASNSLNLVREWFHSTYGKRCPINSTGFWNRTHLDGLTDFSKTSKRTIQSFEQLFLSSCEDHDVIQVA